MKNSEEKNAERVISYRLKGKMVKRRIGERSSLPTNKEIASQQALTLLTNFISPINKFLKKGFELEAAELGARTHNLAYSRNYYRIIKGEYPNLQIDYSQALLSSGKMPITQNLAVKLHPLGLEFTWDPANDQPGCLPGDQAMLLAYFPEKKYGIELLNGSHRAVGKHILPLPGSILPIHVHVYISFIAADHYSISDSTYLGHLIWQKS